MLNKIVLIVAMGFSYTALSDDNVPITPGTCADRPVISTPALIEEGRRLFKEETFNGNGRTCETCHRENHDFTIDAELISKLPNEDTLFVAENNPALRDLENPVMMREFGLIKLNSDGFDKPAVLRGVPHLLGLRQTTALGVKDLIRGELQPVHETGWSADGALNSAKDSEGIPTKEDGSLRCFPVGAIVQHFTKSMDRVNGVDFRLPTNPELDALLVYMLSLGRQSTPDVSTFTFLEPAAERGKTKFFVGMPTEGIGTKTCAECHVEAGASNGATFLARNRIINSNLSPDAPVCRGLELNPPMDIPGDGGFGKSPPPAPFDTIACRTGNVLAQFFGDQIQQSRGFFNTPSLHEAADTGPFFHDNSAETLEDSIRFYSSDPFNVADGANARAFVFGPTDVNDLSAFMRAINALENARSAIDHINKAMAASGKRIDVEPLPLALADSKDGIEVLSTGPLGTLFPKAVKLFRDANRSLSAAIASRKRVDAERAKSKLAAVRSRIAQ